MTTDVSAIAPPCNTEAEQAILGALLFDNSCLGALPEQLEAAHFAHRPHRYLFGLIAAAIREGQTVDPVTLRNRLAGDDTLQELGGQKYLMTLIERASISRAHAHAHGEAVLAAARARHVMEAALALAKRAAGEGNLEAALDEAMAAFAKTELGKEARLVSAHEAALSLLASFDTPKAQAMSTGVGVLDRRLGGGLRKGDLVVLCGRPSMGKTALANNFARNLAFDGYAGLFFSQEMDAEALMMRALAAAGHDALGLKDRFSYSRLRNGAPGISRDVLRNLAKGFEDWRLLIDDRAGLTLTQMLRACRTARQKMRALDFVVVDYLQIMGRPERGGRNTAEIIGEMTQGLKAFARNEDVAVIVLSQLSRAVEQREDKRPMLSDLRESGAIEQDADVVMGVYREAYYVEREQPHAGASNDTIIEWERKLEQCRGRMEVLTMKQRQGPVGSDFLTAAIEFDVMYEPGAARP